MWLRADFSGGRATERRPAVLSFVRPQPFSQPSAGASDQRTELSRAEVILGVRRAYFNALRAENILRVAKATVDARQSVVDQVNELVKAQLKSALDQSFAETKSSRGKTAGASAENERQAAYADFAQSLGRQSTIRSNLRRALAKRRATRAL